MIWDKLGIIAIAFTLFNIGFNEWMSGSSDVFQTGMIGMLVQAFTVQSQEVNVVPDDGFLSFLNPIDTILSGVSTGVSTALLYSWYSKSCSTNTNHCSILRLRTIFT